MENVLLWIQDNWQAIAGTVFSVIIGFALPITRNIMIIALKAILTERALIQAVIYLGDSIVKSTKNNFDNTIWEQVRKDLFKELK
jgi:hypothetical protein